jgi:threonine dehydrogenase-like Zn-dependent dehydrogenase
MKALAITPGKPNSATVRDVPEPPLSYGSVVVKALDLGICGTDFELIAGDYGWAPPDSEYLVLGHESLGEVAEAPSGSGFKPGDLVVGIVRRPDPVPCVACGHGEWDMCRNGQYTERGIKERNGFGSEYWRIEPEYAIKLDSGLRTVGVLTEPASVLAKAWDHIALIGARSYWQPRTLLITGAGPIGLLGALMGKQRGLEVHVIDRVTDGPKPELVKQLGGTYHSCQVKDLGFKADVIIECTGASAVISQCMSQLAGDGILCMAGLSYPGAMQSVDIGGLCKEIVMSNQVIFGTVNANKKHWEMAEQALQKADPTWLGKLISRRAPLSDWQHALVREPNDIKVVIDFSA